MAPNITDLESELLALTRQRVEIDSRWIAISEKLLAAKADLLEAQNKAEVLQVSERSEPNASLLTAETTKISIHSPDTQEEIPTNNEAAQGVATSPNNTQPEISRKEATSAISRDVDNPSHVSGEEQAVDTNSTSVDNHSHLSSVEPAKVASPEPDISLKTTPRVGEQEIGPSTQRQIPPPPAAVPLSTSREFQPQLIKLTHVTNDFPDPIPPQRSEQIVPESATNIGLGDRQLLRTQRPGLQYPQPDGNTQSLPPDLDMTESTRSPTSHLSKQLYYPESSRVAGLPPRSLTPIDSGLHPGWQLWQLQQYQHPRVGFSRQIKAGIIRNPPYVEQSNLRMPQDRTPYQRHFEVVSQQHQQQPFSPRQQTAQTFSGPSYQHQGHVQYPNQSPNFPLQSAVPQTGAGRQRVPQRRRRSPSLEITDIRPSQRPRLGARHSGTDSAPDMQRIKIEDDADFGREDSRRHDRFARSQAPTLQKNRPSEVTRADQDSSSSRPQSDDNRRVRVAQPTVERSAPPREDDTQQLRRRSPLPASHRARARKDINEDYDDETDEDADAEEVNDEFDVPNIEPPRRNVQAEEFDDLAAFEDENSTLSAGLALRTTFGAPKPAPKVPLTLEEKHQLELRYCARVAMVVGSKRCVMAPCEQISKTKNIFTIMRQKFGHVVEGEEPLKDTIKQYRNAMDFVVDARGMLQCYVALGHCTPCPFRNPRVMCWRMRLESVLDQKMRGLKTCLKHCAENFAPDDMQGRCDYIDTWFNEEELQEDVDLY